MKCSGRGVGARVDLEAADCADYVATRRAGAVLAERGMAMHRFSALLRATLSRDPNRMRLKENNRRFRPIRHDFNPFQSNPQKP